MATRRKHSFGAQFDERRTKDGRGDMTVFLANFTSLSAKAGSTHFDDLLAVAEDSKRIPNKSFQIKYIHPSLQTTKFPRDVTYFAKSSEREFPLLARREVLVDPGSLIKTEFIHCWADTI
jgi:hypothetical protein